MHIADIGATARRQAPIPGGPTAALLTPSGTSDQVAVFHLEIPAGGAMPEHDHGASQIVLVPLVGQVEVHHDGRSTLLSPGMTAYVGVGERVRLANPGTGPASVVVVASPAEFADRLASWPAS